MSVYYNEIDQRAIAWLRELMQRGLIPDGEIDTRSIVDVRPADLAGFTQCHFFAGIGGWAYALRLAGWPDDRECWTGSCPCQPWSMAGKGEGADDPRHVWPAWFPLIRERRPRVVFGEQVASTDGRYWLDLVFADLEGIDYAIGAFDLPACSVGAPHKRHRLWFVGDDRLADDDREGRHRQPASRLQQRRTGTSSPIPPAGRTDGARGHDADGRSEPRSLEHADRVGGGRVTGDEGRTERPPQSSRQTEGGRRAEPRDASADDGGAMGDAEDERRARDARSGRTSRSGSEHSGGLGDTISARPQGHARHGDHGDEPRRQRTLTAGPTAAAGSTGGAWFPCDWVPCIDGKARPVEPGLEPLVNGLPQGLGRLRDASAPFHPAEARVMRLRGYGNAIVPQVAAEVVAAYLDVRP